MNDKLREKAEMLTGRPYAIEITHDETTRGEPIYLLSVPDLPGCMAQGDTIDEAATNLQDAKKEYILSLLEDGLPVPSIMVGITETTSRPYTISVDQYIAAEPETDFIDDLSRIVQPTKRERLGSISVVNLA